MKIDGKEISNWWLVGGAAGLGLVFYLYKRSSSGSASSSTGSSGSGIDPVTGLPYTEDNQVDPLTGLTYLAEAQQYGSVSAAESAASSSGYSPYGSSSEGDSYALDAGYPTSDVTTTGTTATSFSSNAQWAQ